MAPPPPSLDYWRGFFSGARATIFDAIDGAIRVAAADHPGELRARRDAIAERLYTALIVLPSAEAAAAAAPAAEPLLVHREQHMQLLPEGAGSVPSLCSSDHAEAITDDGAAAATPLRESDEPVVAEALRVKAALSDNQEKTEAELLELLRRLQRLEFTVDTIRVTEIGTAVKPLRKHSSKLVRQLVRSLVEGWKATVNEWVSNGGVIVDHTPQSMDASCLEQEEEGLPSPPMDEAALFATPCTSIRLSEFFSEMDDDGNIRINAKEGVPVQQYPPNQELVKKEPRGEWYDPEQNWRLEQSSVRQSRLHEPSEDQMRQQSNAGVKGKPSNAAFGPGRPQRLHFEAKCSEMRPKKQQDVAVAQRKTKPTVPNQQALSQDDHAKLEATKRKLQEGYQEFNNVKKQRTIQMVDPQDLPKQGNRNLQPSGKPRNSGTSNIRNRLGLGLHR